MDHVLKIGQIMCPKKQDRIHKGNIWGHCWYFLGGLHNVGIFISSQC